MAATLNDLLYYLEHRFLPRTFFNPNYDLIGTLRENRQLLYDVFRDMCGSEGLECPFSPADFRVSLRQNGEWTGALLVFPVPKAEPLCFEEYLFSDGRPEHMGCFTLEFAQEEDAFGREIRGVLCAWDAQNRHINYGSRTLYVGGDYFAEAFQIHSGRLG